jgi:hypothetical protein
MNHKHRTANAGRRRPLLACVLGVLAAGIFLGPSNSPAQTNADSGPAFDSFRIITQNNIFDPNRSPRFARPDRPRVASHTVDAFSLVGTMSYEKGTFAFFDGSGSQFKKVLEPGGSIAGYTVKEITPQAVTLAANGKEFEMKVGAQLRNEGGNQWRLSMQAELPASPESGSASTVQSSAPPAGATSEQNDILKRLMQNRQQELK